jgi:hypothetical protein
LGFSYERLIRRWLQLVVMAVLLLSAGIRLHAAAPGAIEANDPATAAPEASAEAETFKHERAVADEVLQQPEFQRNLSETWWEQKKRELFKVLESIFGRVGRLGHAAPWLVRTLEWSLFGGAALGLLIFLLRQMARQRLRVELGTSGMNNELWSREPSDWAKRAEAFAAEGAWRDAVHCLYWAAIVLLESRKAWRHNPTRTPREYVRLLKPGSAQQQGLRGLTQIFERSWYGLREVDSSEYDDAKELYDSLLSPRLESRSVVNERLEAQI